MADKARAVPPPHSDAAGARPTGALAWLAQAVLYAAFAVFIGVFSSWPSYSPLATGEALLRLSFNQPGKLVADCRPRSAEELARLAPTMRTAEDCPRERSPIEVRIELDGSELLDEAFAPSGWRRDGAASAYRRLPIAAGSHELRVRIKDDVRASTYTYERTARVNLAPGQVVLIDFAAQRGGVIFR